MVRSFLTVKALLQSAFNEPIDPRVPGMYLDIEGRLEWRDACWEELLKASRTFREDSRVLPPRQKI